jgi:hypothetical protein
MSIQDLELKDLRLNKYRLLDQTIRNGAVEISKRTLVPSAVSTEPLYYALQIPEGRRVFIHIRDLELTQGRYTVDLVQFPEGWSGGTKAYKSPLFEGATPSVQSDVFCNVQPIGTGTVRAELPLVDTGSAQGAQASVGGSAALDTVLKSFFSSNVLIRVQRVSSAADYTSSLLLVMWEEKNNS